MVCYAMPADVGVGTSFESLMGRLRGAGLAAFLPSSQCDVRYCMEDVASGQIESYDLVRVVRIVFAPELIGTP